ncbi:MAG: hypothetical protein HKN79_09890 [Flavobacteriales bacterium]|nr:hypothetical protein [Flavobacteriales bacterium]
MEYDWRFQGELVGIGEELNTTVLESGMLELTISDECGQISNVESEIDLIDYEPLKAHLDSEGVLCRGQENRIELEISGGQEPYSIHWSDGTVDQPYLWIDGFEPIFIQALVIDGCGLSDSDEELMQFSQVEALFLVEELQDFYFRTVDMSSSSIGALSEYYWSINGSDVELDEGNQHPFLDDELHSIGLTVINEYGCTDSWNVSFQPSPLLFIPNAFSPDGDQVNDEFEVNSLGLSELHMEIFDRNGRSILISSGLDSKWDGYDPLRPVHGASYYHYVIQATGKNGEKLIRKGPLSVLR